MIYYDEDKNDIRSFRDDLLQRIISEPEDNVHPTSNELEETDKNEKKKTKKKKRGNKRPKDGR